MVVQNTGTVFHLNFILTHGHHGNVTSVQQPRIVNGVGGVEARVASAHEARVHNQHFALVQFPADHGILELLRGRALQRIEGRVAVVLRRRRLVYLRFIGLIGDDHYFG